MEETYAYEILVLTGRDGHVPLFSICSFIVREQPISFVPPIKNDGFLQFVQTILNCCFKKTIHFVCPSFVFSLNKKYRSFLKFSFVPKKRCPSLLSQDLNLNPPVNLKYILYWTETKMRQMFDSFPTEQMIISKGVG